MKNTSVRVNCRLKFLGTFQCLTFIRIKNFLDDNLEIMIDWDCKNLIWVPVLNKIRKIYQICLHIGSWIAIQWCFHCEGQNVTKIQPCRLALTLQLSHELLCSDVFTGEGQNLTKLQPSTCLNPELRSSNRIQPSRLGLIPPQLASTSASTRLNLCCWASLVEGWGWGHTKGLVGLKSWS